MDGGLARTIAEGTEPMRRTNTLTAVFIAVCIILVAVVVLKVRYSIGGPARVAIADDRNYFPVVHSLLARAESSIDVIIYQGRFYFTYPVSTSNTLLADLIDAGERGVRVRALIEQADWNVDNSEENRDMWNVLRQGGIELYFDPVGTTSHAKLVIVDDRYVVVGSSNWSYYALDVNNEANVVIDSEEAAGRFEEYFEDRIAESSMTYTPAYEPIGVDEIGDWSERYAFIIDLVDSAFHDHDLEEAVLYFGDYPVQVIEGPLEEIMAVDSLFFSTVAGDSARVVARVDRRGDLVGLRALDLEKTDTFDAMARAVEVERTRISKAEFTPYEIGWMEAARVEPVPNALYATEVRKLIKGAKSRIWIAMLDARYYEEPPRNATRTKGPDEPLSLTNEVLKDLVTAAVSGVDVRFVCDLGWGSGRPPQDKIGFLERLSAGGAKVYQDSRDVTTHAKVLIVDNDFVALGSTNWSYYALEENNETAAIIESSELNTHYAAYIEAVIEAGEPFEVSR
jgi:phosphatidylserine/phosphatidylglycerophosphate/cardiolipin synthase-like enzyme